MEEITQDEAKERRGEIIMAAYEEHEIWLSHRDYLILGIRVPKPLRPGERVSSKTGEVRYSAEWL